MKLKWLPLLLVLIACKNEKSVEEKLPEIGVISEHAMVVSAREEASKIGADIMKKGGNSTGWDLKKEISSFVRSAVETFLPRKSTPPISPWRN